MARFGTGRSNTALTFRCLHEAVIITTTVWSRMWKNFLPSGARQVYPANRCQQDVTTEFPYVTTLHIQPLQSSNVHIPFRDIFSFFRARFYRVKR